KLRSSSPLAPRVDGLAQFEPVDLGLIRFGPRVPRSARENGDVDDLILLELPGRFEHSERDWVQANERRFFAVESYASDAHRLSVTGRRGGVCLDGDKDACHLLARLESIHGMDTALDG